MDPQLTQLNGITQQVILYIHLPQLVIMALFTLEVLMIIYMLLTPMVHLNGNIKQVEAYILLQPLDQMEQYISEVLIKIYMPLTLMEL